MFLAGKEINYHNEELVEFINARRLNDRVSLLDEQSNIDDFMAKLDVFVLSSIDESFPNVIGEAMVPIKFLALLQTLETLQY